MSQPPSELPPPAPQPALNYYGPIETPKLRGTPKVFAIIAIVLGSIGLLGICGLPQYFIDIGPPNPVINVIRGDRLMFPYTVGSLVLGIILAGFLLFGGIKTLKLEPRGRTILLGISWVEIVLGAAGLVISIVYVLPKFSAIAKQNPTDLAWKYGIIGGQIGFGIGLVSLLYYCAMVYVFTRPGVKAQFEPAKVAGQM